MVLETIGIADLKKKLVARHVAMLAHLAATALRVSSSGRERWAARAGWLCQEGYASAARGSVAGSAAT